MNAQVIRYKSRFEIETKYAEVLVAEYKRIDGKYYDMAKKTWSFPNAQFNKVIELLKTHNYNVSVIDRSTPALFFLIKSWLYVKINFSPEIRENFNQTFITAVYNHEDNDWKLGSSDYPAVKEFFNKHAIPYIYVNQQVDTYLSYIQEKIEKIEQHEALLEVFDVSCEKSPNKRARV